MKEQHGGDIWSVAKATGLAPEVIIDFSASINPRGLSRDAVAALATATGEDRRGLLSAYPEPSAKELTQELARYHGLPPENTLVANGSNELIYLTAQLLRPSRALIVEPAFSEYRRALEGVGCEVDSYRLLPDSDFRFDAEGFTEKINSGYDLCIVTNPTSHAGGLIPKADMLKVIEKCRSAGIFLLIDEAFCDFTEQASCKAEAASGEGLIVLRSMTKFFAMAGLRLGYAVASDDIISRLATLRPTWSVNLLATVAGIASLRDSSYIQSTLGWFKEERAHMEGLLGGIGGVRVFSGDANFFLCSLDEALMSVGALREMLTARGVLIRDMTEVEGLGKGYFRVALKSRGDNELLSSLLGEVLTKGVVSGVI